MRVGQINRTVVTVRENIDHYLFNFSILSKIGFRSELIFG